MKESEGRLGEDAHLKQKSPRFGRGTWKTPKESDGVKTRTMLSVFGENQRVPLIRWPRQMLKRGPPGGLEGPGDKGVIWAVSSVRVAGFPHPSIGIKFLQMTAKGRLGIRSKAGDRLSFPFFYLLLDPHWATWVPCQNFSHFVVNPPLDYGGAMSHFCQQAGHDLAWRHVRGPRGNVVSCMGHISAL